MTRSVINSQSILQRVFNSAPLCAHVSCAEVSSVLGPSSSFSSETGSARPDGPPSQPHALHRSQVTNGNHIQLCVTDVFTLISFCSSFDASASICCHSAEDIFCFCLLSRVSI